MSKELSLHLSTVSEQGQRAFLSQFEMLTRRQVNVQLSHTARNLQPYPIR